MNREELLLLIHRHAAVQFARSGGPGGQNVNKVNTKATLRLSLAILPVDEQERNALRLGLKKRVNREGELIVHCSKTRSQVQNRLLAEQKAAGFILKALEKPRKRRKTRPSRGANERRLQSKKKRGEIKRQRKLFD
jgi:ribosome-associated protein